MGAGALLPPTIITLQPPRAVCSAHNRKVAGSNPASPMRGHFLIGVRTMFRNFTEVWSPWR